jgi:hypothetical protein
MMDLFLLINGIIHTLITLGGAAEDAEEMTWVMSLLFSLTAALAVCSFWFLLR